MSHWIRAFERCQRLDRDSVPPRNGILVGQIRAGRLGVLSRRRRDEHQREAGKKSAARGAYRLLSKHVFDLLLHSFVKKLGIGSALGVLTLILGFQGFLHVPLHVTSDDDPPERIDVAMTLDVDGFDRLGGQQPQVPFLDGYDEPVSRVVLFFLTSGNVGEWRDRFGDRVA